MYYAFLSRKWQGGGGGGGGGGITVRERRFLIKP